MIRQSCTLQSDPPDISSIHLTPYTVIKILLTIQGWTKIGLQLFPWKIDNNTRLNSVLPSHNCKPTFAHP